MSFFPKAAAALAAFSFFIWPAGVYATELVSYRATYDLKFPDFNPGDEVQVNIDGNGTIALLRFCRGWRLVSAVDANIYAEAAGESLELPMQMHMIWEELLDGSVGAYRMIVGSGEVSAESRGRVTKHDDGTATFEITLNGQTVTLPMKGGVLLPVETAQELISRLASGQTAFAIQTFAPEQHSAAQMEVWDVQPLAALEDVEDPDGLLAGAQIWKHKFMQVNLATGDNSEATQIYTSNGITARFEMFLLPGVSEEPIEFKLTKVEALQPEPCL